jgi:hypothetical protein
VCRRHRGRRDQLIGERVPGGLRLIRMVGHSCFGEYSTIQEYKITGSIVQNRNKCSTLSSTAFRSKLGTPWTR